MKGVQVTDWQQAFPYWWSKINTSLLSSLCGWLWIAEVNSLFAYVVVLLLLQKWLVSNWAVPPTCIVKFSWGWANMATPKKKLFSAHDHMHAIIGTCVPFTLLITYNVYVGNSLWIMTSIIPFIISYNVVNPQTSWCRLGVFGSIDRHSNSIMSPVHSQLMRDASTPRGAWKVRSACWRSLIPQNI